MTDLSEFEGRIITGHSMYRQPHITYTGFMMLSTTCRADIRLTRTTSSPPLEALDEDFRAETCSNFSDGNDLRASFRQTRTQPNLTQAPHERLTSFQIWRLPGTSQRARKTRSSAGRGGRPDVPTPYPVDSRFQSSSLMQRDGTAV